MKTGPKPRPVSERLELNCIPEPNSGCWLWTASLGTAGYGQVGVAGKPVGAHRAAYEAWVGPIPEGLHVCHKCDTKTRINPAHLFIGTAADNCQDMVEKGRAYMQKGSAHPLVKLSDEQVVNIRADSRPSWILASEYCVSRSNISAIRNYVTWKSA